jgi:polar amino acid transport system substrate-binding protein
MVKTKAVMSRIVCLSVFMLAVLPVAVQANDFAPTGTLRATFIDTNSAQAKTDPATGEVSGPAADLTRALAKQIGVPFTIKSSRGVGGVMETVKKGEADIGFLAFDPVRAAEVDFSQTFMLAQNTYLVLENSPIRVAADVDKPGIRVGVGARDAGDYFLTRNLKHATIKRNEAGTTEIAIAWLKAGEIDVYAGNRQRMSEAVARAPGLRLTPDNFYGVEQCIIIAKGDAAGGAAKLAVVNRFLDEARASGAIAAAIERAGLVGVDVAPPGTR